MLHQIKQLVEHFQEIETMSYKTMQRRTEAKTFRTQKQKAETPDGKTLEVVYDHRENNLLLKKTDAEAVTVGTSFNLLLSGCSVIITGTPTHGETVMYYPVQQFHLFGELFRAGAGAVDNFGRHSPELLLTATGIPLIVRGTQNYFTDPELDIRQGDVLKIRNNTHHIHGVRSFTGQLAELSTVKQL